MALTFVGGNTAGCNALVQPLTVSYAATAGNFVCVFVTAYNTGSGAITGVTDNNGHSLTLDLEKAATLHDSLDMVWFSYTCPANTASFSVSYPGFGSNVVTVLEFSSSGAVSFDVGATAQNLTGASPWFGQSVTTTAASGVVLGGGFHVFSPDLAGTGSWSLGSAGHDGGSSFFGGAVYQITSSAAAYQPSGTSAGNNNTAALTISYKEASGGGGTTYSNSVSLALSPAIADTNALLAANALTFTNSVTIASSNKLTAAPTLSLALSPAIASTNKLTAVNAITLTEAIQLALTNNAVVNNTAAIILTPSIVTIGGVAYSASISPSLTLSIVASGALAPAGTPAVVVSGQLVRLNGDPEPGTVVATLTRFGTSPRIAGHAVLAPITTRVTAASDGTWQLTLWGADQLVVPGAYYVIRILSATGAVIASARYQLNSGTYALSGLVPYDS